jgi:hypothetical protein
VVLIGRLGRDKVGTVGLVRNMTDVLRNCTLIRLFRRLRPLLELRQFERAAARYPLKPPLRLNARLMVEGACV